VDTPTQGEAIRALIGAELDELWTAIPGRLVSWDRSIGVGSVAPLVQLADGTALPVIPGIPVVFPCAFQDLNLDTQGGHGLLIACTSDWRRWWRGEGTKTPETVSRHQLSNSVFLPGLRSRGMAREIPADAAVLERPVVGGTVRLGSTGANKAVVHEDLLSGLDDLLAALDTWGQAVQVATGVLWLAPQIELLALRAGIAAGSYQSPTVMVED